MPVATIALLASLVLSGCVGGSDSSEQGEVNEPGSSVARPGELSENAGTIQGTILDEVGLPIVGARVGILELELEAKTDESGGFEFTNLDPGPVPLYVSRLGYEPAVQTVIVKAGEAVDVEIVLIQVEIFDPYSKVIGPVDGFFECRAGATFVVSTFSGRCGFVCAPFAGCTPSDVLTTLWPNDKNGIDFSLDSDHWSAVVGEMTWTAGSFATSQELSTTFSYEGRSGTHWFCGADGTNPLKFVYINAESDDCDTGDQQLPDEQPQQANTNLTLTMWGGVPFGSVSVDNPQPLNLAFQQEFTLIATVFYGQPVPDGYTAFGQ